MIELLKIRAGMIETLTSGLEESEVLLGLWFQVPH